MRFRTKDDRNVKSLVSCLLFYGRKHRERRFESLLFSHAESILHNAHDREEYFFVFLVLLSIYTMKRYLKIRRGHENALVVVRVALKKMRILLYYYYSYYY